MHLHVAEHPLIAQKLTALRDQTTPSTTFRALTDELVTLLAYEATRGLRTEPCEIETPVAPTTGVTLAEPIPLVVPILRAGLGMLPGMMRLLPDAEVGFLGIVRNHDPMLATGGTLVAAMDLLFARGATDITVICLIAAPEGIGRLQEVYHGRLDVAVVCAGLDERLTDRGYIYPGLGDAGDRLFGSGGY